MGGVHVSEKYRTPDPEAMKNEQEWVGYHNHKHSNLILCQQQSWM